MKEEVIRYAHDLNDTGAGGQGTHMWGKQKDSKTISKDHPNGRTAVV